MLTYLTYLASDWSDVCSSALIVQEAGPVERSQLSQRYVTERFAGVGNSHRFDLVIADAALT